MTSMANVVASDRLLPTERPVGEAGIWVFIFGDMFIFTMLFAAITYYRGQYPDAFANGQLELMRMLGLVNTLVLLCGSILVVRATQLAREGNANGSARLLQAGILCGAIFIAIKGYEYATLIEHGYWIRSNYYFMLFFVITGAHLMHVMLGMVVLLMMQRMIRRGVSTAREHALFESGACYWHMVDLLWLILFPLFYLVN